MSGALPQRLVTVSSPEFLFGTRVMLHSFLATNRWFSGDIVVLHNRLRPAEMKLLETSFANLSCRMTASLLSETLDRLVTAFPHLENRRDRFLSLDMLLDTNTMPSLFLDSDMVVRGDLSPLAEIDTVLVACPDATVLRGLRRDLQTMEEKKEGGGRTFNAGMLLLRMSSPGLAKMMFERLSPESWAAIRSDHTDQAVWNLLFAESVQLADRGYNFMVGHAALQPLAERQWHSLRVLHFNGQAKPWLPERQKAVEGAGGLVGWAFGEWREAARAMLADAP